MRFGHVANFAIAIVLALGVVAASEEAKAQSFFQSLFSGGGAKPKSRPAPPVRTRRYNTRPAVNWALLDQTPAKRVKRSSSTRYRTMCVRMCDGFYWPVSASITRKNFARDARTCRSRCGSRSRLFYQPAGASSPDDMKDFRGLRYASLDIAFKYRKKLVKGCQCRPDPWSVQEQSRHERYAAVENRQNGQVVARLSGDSKRGSTTVEVSDKAEDDAIDGVERGTQAQNESPDAADATDFDSIVTKRRATAYGRDQRNVIAPKRAKKRKQRHKQKRKRIKTAKRQKKKSQNSWFAPSKAKYRWPGD